MWRGADVGRLRLSVDGGMVASGPGRRKLRDQWATSRRLRVGGATSVSDAPAWSSGHEDRGARDAALRLGRRARAARVGRPRAAQYERRPASGPLGLRGGLAALAARRLLL